MRRSGLMFLLVLSALSVAAQQSLGKRWTSSEGSKVAGKWSGGRSAKGKMDAEYYTSGNGSAVVENLLSDGKPTMTTVYHLDGDALRATHFCALQSQPRLKAARIVLPTRSISDWLS